MTKLATTLALLLLAATAGPAAEAPSHTLVRYDFDGQAIETGPWLIVWENSSGSVSLTSTYRFSGDRSVEIRDVAGDGEFTELQGFFPNKADGRLFIHFVFMTAEPEEPLNIALAGPAHFSMKKDGMGFWLKTRDGTLYHVSDSRERALFPVRGFTWYIVDVSYDIDRGVYDLSIAEEARDEPLVSVQQQPNAMGLPGSLIHKFSFIGDPPGFDGSNAVFYVDDIVVSADRPIRRGPFVAPGRRMLFVDAFDHYQARMYEKPGCPAALDHADFGFSDGDLQELGRGGHLGLFDALAERKRSAGSTPDDAPRHLRTRLDAMRLWQRGCSAPAGCKTPCALELFEQAADDVPRAKMYSMSAVLALAAEKRWAEADELFLSIYPDWQSDPRFPAISAVLGIARGELREAESWLQSPAADVSTLLGSPVIRRLWSGELDRGLVRDLKAELGSDWTDHVASALISEHKYYVLLWQDETEVARVYARRMVERYREMELPAGKWLEREADAAFFSEDYTGALVLYEESLKGRGSPTSALLKLSDVHFKLGNLDQERVYREKIYGSLGPE